MTNDNSLVKPDIWVVTVGNEDVRLLIRQIISLGIDQRTMQGGWVLEAGLFPARKLYSVSMTEDECIMMRLHIESFNHICKLYDENVESILIQRVGIPEENVKSIVYGLRSATKNFGPRRSYSVMTS